MSEAEIYFKELNETVNKTHSEKGHIYKKLNELGLSTKELYPFAYNRRGISQTPFKTKRHDR